MIAAIAKSDPTCADQITEIEQSRKIRVLEMNLLQIDRRID